MLTYLITRELEENLKSRKISLFRIQCLCAYIQHLSSYISGDFFRDRVTIFHLDGLQEVNAIFITWSKLKAKIPLYCTVSYEAFLYFCILKLKKNDDRKENPNLLKSPFYGYILIVSPKQENLRNVGLYIVLVIKDAQNLCCTLYSVDIL